MDKAKEQEYKYNKSKETSHSAQHTHIHCCVTALIGGVSHGRGRQITPPQSARNNQEQQMSKGYRNTHYYTVLLGLCPTKGQSSSSAFSHGLEPRSHAALQRPGPREPQLHSPECWQHRQNNCILLIVQSRTEPIPV